MFIYLLILYISANRLMFCYQLLHPVHEPSTVTQLCSVSSTKCSQSTVMYVLHATWAPSNCTTHTPSGSAHSSSGSLGSFLRLPCSSKDCQCRHKSRVVISGPQLPHPPLHPINTSPILCFFPLFPGSWFFKYNCFLRFVYSQSHGAAPWHSKLSLHL